MADDLATFKARADDLVATVKARCEQLTLAISDIIARQQKREMRQSFGDGCAPAWTFPARIAPPRMPDPPAMASVRIADLSALCEALRGLLGTINHLDTERDIHRLTDAFDRSGRTLDGWIAWLAERGNP